MTTPSTTRLGPGEIRTLRGIARGLSIAETAREMHVTKSTVRSYLRSIYAKWDVTTREDAVRSGRRRGVITNTCPTCGHGGTT